MADEQTPTQQPTQSKRVPIMLRWYAAPVYAAAAYFAGREACDLLQQVGGLEAVLDNFKLLTDCPGAAMVYKLSYASAFSALFSSISAIDGISQIRQHYNQKQERNK